MKLHPLYLHSFGILLTILFPVVGAANSVPQDRLKLDVSVRSMVDRPFQGLRKAPVKENGKLYYLAAISEAPAAKKLMLPVDENAMLTSLREELAKRGFREIGPDETPEIILTVIYGRGWLRNPYMQGMMEGADSETYGGLPVVNVVGVDNRFMRGKEFGYEEKLQRANNEKLFIRVTAWDYPKDEPLDKKGRKPKPKTLWHTTINVDDPDGLDLNRIHKELLAAGAHFFDREMDREEEIVPAFVPEGRVILAPLHFAEEEAAGRENPAGK